MAPFQVSYNGFTYWTPCDNNIRCDKTRVGNSFSNSGYGLLLGKYALHSRTVGVPRWDNLNMREWLHDEDDPETAAPHVMLAICTEDADVKSDRLLLGEIGSIAQAIQNRLDQKEFEKTSFFPVCSQIKKKKIHTEYRSLSGT